MAEVAVAVWNFAAAAFSGTAFGTAQAGTALAVANAGAQFAANVTLALAVNSVVANNTKPKDQGGLIDLTLDSAAPRRLVVGKRMTGGVLVDWYLAGNNNTKLYLPVYLSEGPCGQITRVFAGGREVWSTPLAHGVRTTIPDFRSGGDRLWLTYYDGRVGQTADPALVALSQGWTSDNTMEGCAYVVIECQWDSDNLRAPPQLTFEMEGAKLYDRRLDGTAGGTGSHRIDNPATWAWSDNPMVALDHFLLGRYLGGRRTFGIGLSADEVPYDRFAAQANICDEDVDLKAGGTQKRYRANGIVFASDDYANTITQFCTAMAARPADFGGRFGVIGIESRSPVLTIDDGDLIADGIETYTPKRSWSNLVGAVEGRYQDPAQLYQPVDFPRVTDAAWEAEDGGEPKVLTLELDFETNVERAQRLALLKARAERRQATLKGVYPLWAIELERGDWFVRTGAKWGDDGKTFEVIERILNTENYTVSLVAQEVDAADSAWDESTAQDGPPAAIASTDEISAVAAPSLTVTSNPIVGAASNTPAIKVAFTNPTDPRVHTLFIEVVRDSDGLKVATLPVTIPDADEEVIIQNGIADDVDYTVQAKFLTPGLQSDWSDPEGVTTGATYAVGAADSVAWSGVTDSGGKPDDNADVTSANTAAAITWQGPWATEGSAVANVLAPNPNLYKYPSGDGSGAAATGGGWGAPSGGMAGGGLTQTRFDWLGGNIYLDSFTNYTSGSDRYYPLDVPIVNHNGGDITVSWVGRAANLDATVAQVYGIGASSEDRGSTAQVALTGSGRRSVTLTPTGNVATLRIYMGIPAQTKSGYSDIGIRSIKVENGSAATAYQNDRLDVGPDADETAINTAAAIVSQGAFATLSSAAYGSGLLTGFGVLASLGQVYFGDGYIKETSGGTTASLSAFKTVLGTAAAITSQGALATLSAVGGGEITNGAVDYLKLAATAVRLGTNIVRNDGSTSVTDALVVTSIGTASAITSQGALATLSAVAWASLITGRPANLAALAGTENVNNATIKTGSPNTVKRSDMEVAGDLGEIGLYNGSGATSPALSRSTSSPASAQKPAVLFTCSAGVNGVGYYASLGTRGFPDADFVRRYIPVKAGDRVQLAIELVSLSGASGVTGVQVYGYQHDAAGAAVGYLSGTTPANAANAVTTPGRLGTFVTATHDGFVSMEVYLLKASGTTTAITSALLRDFFVAPARVDQTNLDPYTPGSNAKDGADQTAANTAAAITGQGSQATANHQRGTSYSGTPVEGSWWADTSTSQLKLYTGGSWQIVSDIGGAVKLTIGSAINVVGSSGFSGTIAVTPSGGSGSYTYRWSKEPYEAGVAATLSNATTATVTVAASLSTGQDSTGRVRCDVTDSEGRTASITQAYNFSKTS